jgi:hypothetical protein
MWLEYVAATRFETKFEGSIRALFRAKARKHLPRKEGVPIL